MNASRFTPHLIKAKQKEVNIFIYNRGNVCKINLAEIKNLQNKKVLV